jgi:hypothetical protein
MRPVAPYHTAWWTTQLSSRQMRGVCGDLVFLHREAVFPVGSSITPGNRSSKNKKSSRSPTKISEKLFSPAAARHPGPSGHSRPRRTTARIAKSANCTPIFAVSVCEHGCRLHHRAAIGHGHGPLAPSDLDGWSKSRAGKKGRPKPAYRLRHLSMQREERCDGASDRWRAQAGKSSCERPSQRSQQLKLREVEAS